MDGDAVVAKPSGQAGITTHVIENSNFISRTWSWIIQSPGSGVKHLMQLIVSRWTVVVGESLKTQSKFQSGDSNFEAVSVLNEELLQE